MPGDRRFYTHGPRYRIPRAAAAWGRVASLIETCKMNGVEPYAWFKSTLEKIATGHPQSKIHELLPWNFGPATDAD